MNPNTFVSQPRCATIVAVDGLNKPGSTAWNPSLETYTTR